MSFLKKRLKISPWIACLNQNNTGNFCSETIEFSLVRLWCMIFNLPAVFSVLLFLCYKKHFFCIQFQDKRNAYYSLKYVFYNCMVFHVIDSKVSAIFIHKKKPFDRRSKNRYTIVIQYWRVLLTCTLDKILIFQLESHKLTFVANASTHPITTPPKTKMKKHSL